MKSIIFHIDVNSAYLSWTSVERLKNGETIDLREIPSIIGGDMKSRRGVVLAKSIPAKRYGIKTGEPVVHALRKCPNLTMVPPNHTLYSEYSKKLMSLLKSFSPNIEKVSIDECYMDFSEQDLTVDEAVNIASMLKERVYETYGFTVNVGISTTKILAKMASDFQKPNKVHTLFLNEIAAKMWPLPVSELYMVGRAAAVTLDKLEIKTIGDLACADVSILVSHMKSHGKLIWNYANGIDDSVVQSSHIDAKNIGSSTTLPYDFESSSEAKKILKSLSMEVASRLKKSGQLAGSIGTEIKYSTFQSASHQMKLDPPTCDAKVIYQSSCRLFDELWNGDPIRLLGVRTAKLTKEAPPMQMNIFDLGKVAKERKADKAMEELQDRFGSHILKKGL